MNDCYSTFVGARAFSDQEEGHIARACMDDRSIIPLLYPFMKGGSRSIERCLPVCRRGQHGVRRLDQRSSSSAYRAGTIGSHWEKSEDAGEHVRCHSHKVIKFRTRGCSSLPLRPALQCPAESLKPPSPMPRLVTLSRHCYSFASSPWSPPGNRRSTRRCHRLPAMAYTSSITISRQKQ